MKRLFFICCLLLIRLVVVAQFAPPAGQVGTTAIHKDSSVFIDWATSCTVVRGYQDISNTFLRYASAGDSSMALGIAGNGIVSLGDGGYAIVTFAHPISNGVGWDFAVFENSFSDTFLELSFVEVSSDGINYFRFPCTSYTQDTIQVSGFGNVDATKIDNLAGKYRAMYGTPFDLQQLSLQAGLNINAVTHIKIIDVVGCIQNAFARYDQYGNKINDPWNTPFASGGFDLDAVGVIHNSTNGIDDADAQINFNVYPNPTTDNIIVGTRNFVSLGNIEIINLQGQIIKNISCKDTIFRVPTCVHTIDVSAFPQGMYFIKIITEKGIVVKKFVKE